jgi:hypothetical protein
MLDKVKPAAIGARPAPVFVNWQVGGAEDNPSQFSRQVIRAELIGSDACSAAGITIRSSAPVLALCRRLIAAGHDPATPLEAYRGETLCLCVRSIGQGAQLKVDVGPTGRPFFKREKARVIAPPIAPNRRGAP